MLPHEILFMVWKYLDARNLYNSAQVCTEWNQYFCKKSSGKLIKDLCFTIWRKDTYASQKSYLSKFQNWRHMLKMRPLLRFDGFYVCKMMYRRNGLSDSSMNHPVHEVVSYKYIRFYPDGSTISLYTNSTPRKFMSRISKIF